MVSENINTEISENTNEFPSFEEESYEEPLRERGNDDVPLQSTKTGSDPKENMLDSNTDNTTYLKAKSTKPISYLELVDLGSIDCTESSNVPKSSPKNSSIDPGFD